MEIPNISGNFLTIFAAGGAIGAAFTFWAQIKSGMNRFLSYLIIQADCGDWNTSKAVCTFCFCKLKRSKVGPRRYSSIDVFVRPVGKRQIVAAEQIGQGGVVFWQGWRPIWVSMKDWHVTFTFIRGTFRVDKFLQEAVDFLNSTNDAIDENADRRFVVKYVMGKEIFMGKDKNSDSPDGDTEGLYHKHLRLIKYKHEDLGAKRSLVSAVDLLSLAPDIKEAVKEARFWRKAEKWYSARNIPWRRGLLLYGLPGTGKTSLARAIAEDLDLPVFVFDLASMTNEDMRTSWKEMLKSTPCMVVLEDIDSVFDGRKNLCDTGKLRRALTFDCLLNCIDGIEKTDGLFVVITTNNVGSVDVAIGGGTTGQISKRPGRVDRVLECRPPDREGLLKIATRILSDEPHLLHQVVEHGITNVETAAQFQERCARVALNCLWKRDPFFEIDNGKPIEIPEVKVLVDHLEKIGGDDPDDDDDEDEGDDDE